MHLILQHALPFALFRYVSTVEAAGATDNTIFIVTSDHGDMHMERQQFYKMVPYVRPLPLPYRPLPVQCGNASAVCTLLPLRRGGGNQVYKVKNNVNTAFFFLKCHNFEV